MTDPTAADARLIVQNLVCDLDGVVYLGDESVPGAGETLERIAGGGVHIVFATNNSTTTPAGVAERIADLTGYAPDPDDVITSSVAAADLLRGRASVALVVGEEGIRSALADAGIATTDSPQEANAVVVGLDRSLTYERLRLAVRAVHGGALLVATNTDATYPTHDGLWPGGGAIVAAIERAAGVDAVVAGKPHTPMIEAIRRRLRAGDTAVVGDRPETDLALAAAAGWRRILVLSGITASAEQVPTDLRPDLTLSSIAGLPEHLRSS
jgi:4-nitrophenyl phosphatase